MGSKPLQSSKNGATVLALWYESFKRPAHIISKKGHKGLYLEKLWCGIHYEENITKGRSTAAVSTVLLTNHDKLSSNLKTYPADHLKKSISYCISNVFFKIILMIYRLAGRRQQTHNVKTNSHQLRNVASTFIRRCFNVLCLLGPIQNKLFYNILSTVCNFASSR